MTDDAQHLRCRRLLLQRFAEIVGALAQFVEQPRILDGDDGLGGEVLHQRDLLVGERPDLLAVDDNGADELIIFEHGYYEFGPRAGGIGKCYDEAIAVEVALVKPKIGNMDDLFAFNDAVERGAGVLAYVDHRLPAIMVRIVRVAMNRHRAQAISLAQEQIAQLRFTNARRILQHGVKDRLQLAG